MSAYNNLQCLPKFIVNCYRISLNNDFFAEYFIVRKIHRVRKTKIFILKRWGYRSRFLQFFLYISMHSNILQTSLFVVSRAKVQILTFRCGEYLSKFCLMTKTDIQTSKCIEFMHTQIKQIDLKIHSYLLVTY